MKTRNHSLNTHLALAAVLALTAAGTAQAALTMALTGDAPTPADTYWAGEIDGYMFTVGAQDINVSWLGWYDAPNDGAGSIGDGLKGEIQIGIWETTSTILLTQTTLDSGTNGTAMSGSFRGQNITPVTLSANTTYTIAGHGLGGDLIHDFHGTTGFTINGITMIGGIYGYDLSMSTMPNNGWEYLIGPNFGFTIPEPSALLLGSASLLLLLRRHRK